MLKTAASAALCSVVLTGCIKDNGRGEEPGRGEPVVFQTTIAKTRASENRWEYGDRIGVYMISSPSSGEWDSTPPLAENKLYVHDLEEGQTSENVIFTGFDTANTIVWPGGEGLFDIVAYYPYTAGIRSGFIYLIDLSDQEPQKDIDLMWSDNVKGRASGSPALGFKHKLSKLVFNVTDLGGESLAGLRSTFEGLPHRASFSLPAGEVIADTSGGTEPFDGELTGLGSVEVEAGEGTDNLAVVEAIVLPGDYGDGYTVTFLLGDGSRAVFEVEDAEYEAGMRYIYNISLVSSDGDPASFGEAEGGLKQITGWGEGGSNEEPVELPLVDPGETPGDDLSASWGPMPLTNDASMTVEGAEIENGECSLSSGGKLTISKFGCEGIVSVTISISKSPAKGTISSVKVGGHNLVIDHDGNPATGEITSSPIEGGRYEGGPFLYTFHTADGKPLAGDIEVVIDVAEGEGLRRMSVGGLGTNTDITPKNP